MVWVKEETEDDESPEEKLGAITDSAKQRDFNDSEEKKVQGTSEGEILIWEGEREKRVTRT